MIKSEGWDSRSDGWRPNLDSIWTPGVGSDQTVGCKCLRGLVDLVRFELTTSSMPFKKYQPVTDVSTRNKRLSRRRFGRQWTPREQLWGVWTPRGLQDPHRGLARGVFSRAVVGASHYRLLETTTIDFSMNGGATLHSHSKKQEPSPPTSGGFPSIEYRRGPFRRQSYSRTAAGTAPTVAPRD